MSYNSIQSKFLRNMLFIAVVSMLLWSFLWIQGEYSDFITESKRLRIEYIQSHKQSVKNEVNKLVQHVKLRRTKEEDKLKQTLKARVYTAHNIASNIYKENIGLQTHNQIIKMIKDALRPVRFDNGKGYYFAGSMDGVEILYPVMPETEGKNQINLQDLKGNFVILDEIKIAKEANEGFVTHYWAKPGFNPAQSFPKLSFIKYFKPLDLYFGTGAYLDSTQDQLKREILAIIAKEVFDKDNYFFGTTYAGDPLFSNGIVTTGQSNRWDLTDQNGIKIIQEQRKTIENKDGGFVNCLCQKNDASPIANKISFVTSIPEWEWIIGAGFYTHTVDNIMSAKVTAMKSHFKKQIIRSIIILVILLMFIWFWSQRILKQIQKSIHVFSSFLKKTDTDSILIDPDNLELKEFKEIAKLTNKMLKKRLIAEETMQESEKKFRKMYESTQVGVVIVSLDFKIKQANNAYCTMLGYSGDEIIGKAVQEVTNPEDITENIKKLTELGLENISSFQMEKRFIHKNGNIVYGLLSATLILDKNKKPQYFLENVIDITDKKKAEETEKNLEEKLHQAQKMEAIGSLAGGIAHDFNNVLFSIIGFTELTIEDLPEKSLERSNLKQVLTAANRAKDMVQQILAFSRKTETEKKPIKIQLIIKEVIKLLSSSIPSTIEIKANIDKNCTAVIADSSQIHQIIMNLATNASHAMKKKGGIMEFILEQENINHQDLSNYSHLHTGTYAKLTIKDTGHGIPKKVMGKIFDPYFTTKKVGEGTGMGLSVVHGIILDHGGDIIVDSEPDKGSSFTIFLPIHEKTTNIKQDIQISEQIPTGTENILVVDDEKQIVKMTNQLLKRLGYHVTSYTDSEKALEAFKKEPDKFDIIITDMTMPKLTGIELAAILLKIKPDVKIILCSGYSELINKETALSMGIKKYIAKPINQKEIACTIRKIIEQEKK